MRPARFASRLLFCSTVLWLQYAQRRTIAARGALGATIGVVVITMALLFGATGSAHSQTKPMPSARPAIDGILEAFGSHSLVALGDAHGMAQEQDFYAALVRDPRFAHEVGNVVVEFGSAAHQDIMDRYTNGQNVSYTELRKVWTDTVGWAPQPFELGYVNFFAQVRATNLALPPGQRIHVWLGEPPLDWTKVEKHEDFAPPPEWRKTHPEDDIWAWRDSYPAELIKRKILSKGSKALVIYGSNHFLTDTVISGAIMHNDGPVLAVLLEREHPGALFTILPYMGFFADNNCRAEFEKKISGPAPLLLSPMRGTTLDDPSFRLRCPLPNILPPTVPAAQRADVTDRLARWLMGMSADALLYLGPASSFSRSSMLPDVYLDEDYLKEIERRWRVTGPQHATPDTMDMTAEKNGAAPRPYRP